MLVKTCRCARANFPVVEYKYHYNYKDESSDHFNQAAHPKGTTLPGAAPSPGAQIGGRHAGQADPGIRPGRIRQDFTDRRMGSQLQRRKPGFLGAPG